MQLTLFDTTDLLNYERNIMGDITGKVWNSLNEREKSLKELAKELLIDKESLLLSIGWLFQEDKINVKTKGKRVLLRLK